jgi:hypothetical protein
VGSMCEIERLNWNEVTINTILENYWKN